MSKGGKRFERRSADFENRPTHLMDRWATKEAVAKQERRRKNKQARSSRKKNR